MNDLLKERAIVIEIIDSYSFRVRLKDGEIIDANISSKMKRPLDFNIYVGEEVPIDMPPYDRTRGRINFRHWIRTKPPKQGALKATSE